MRRKLLSVILMTTMMLTLLPSDVFAAESAENDAEEPSYSESSQQPQEKIEPEVFSESTDLAPLELEIILYDGTIIH